MRSHTDQFNEFQEQKKISLRYLDFINKKTDRRVALLGAMGNYSGAAIAADTGISLSRVYYRLKHAHIRLKEVRNGQSPFSKIIMRAAEAEVDRALLKHLAKNEAITREQIARSKGKQ